MRQPKIRDRREIRGSRMQTGIYRPAAGRKQRNPRQSLRQDETLKRRKEKSK